MSKTTGRVTGTRELWLASLAHDGTAFRDAARSADLDAHVPSCPDWALADLVAHLGTVYAYVCSHVSRGVTDPPPVRLAEFPSSAPAGPAVLDWFDERFAELGTVLENLDGDLPAWNWGPRPKVASFWQRRMAHETAVHRWDAQTAAGLPEPLDPKLAVDGVTEVFDTWLPAGRRRGRTDVTGLAHLVATDAGYDWHVRLRGQGVALLAADTMLREDRSPHVETTGTASDLNLALYGRIGFDLLDSTGDPTLLDALRTG